MARKFVTKWSDKIKKQNRKTKTILINHLRLKKKKLSIRLSQMDRTSGKKNIINKSLLYYKINLFFFVLFNF